MKNFTLLLMASLVCAVPALANVTITSPNSGAEVVSPFRLVATTSMCSSQPVSSIGYAIDNSTKWTTFKGPSIDTTVASITGAHTVHVNAWIRGGAECETFVAIIVVPDPISLVPADALVFKRVQALRNWQGNWRYCGYRQYGKWADEDGGLSLAEWCCTPVCNEIHKLR